jgi:hypothetical protein
VGRGAEGGAVDLMITFGEVTALMAVADWEWLGMEAEHLSSMPLFFFKIVVLFYFVGLVVVFFLFLIFIYIHNIRPYKWWGSVAEMTCHLQGPTPYGVKFFHKTYRPSTTKDITSKDSPL